MNKNFILFLGILGLATGLHSSSTFAQTADFGFECFSPPSTTEEDCYSKGSAILSQYCSIKKEKCFYNPQKSPDSHWISNPTGLAFFTCLTPTTDCKTTSSFEKDPKKKCETGYTYVYIPANPRSGLWQMEFCQKDMQTPPFLKTKSFNRKDSVGIRP